MPFNNKGQMRTLVMAITIKKGDNTDPPFLNISKSTKHSMFKTVE